MSETDAKGLAHKAFDRASEAYAIAQENARRLVDLEHMVASSMVRIADTLAALQKTSQAIFEILSKGGGAGA